VQYFVFIDTEVQLASNHSTVQHIKSYYNSIHSIQKKKQSL